MTRGEQQQHCQTVAFSALGRSRSIVATCCTLLILVQTTLAKISSTTSQADTSNQATDFQILTPTLKQSSSSPSGQPETHAEIVHQTRTESNSHWLVSNISDLLDDNYLEPMSSILEQNNKQEKISNLLDDLQSVSFKSNSKRRPEVGSGGHKWPNQSDWWTKLMSSNKANKNWSLKQANRTTSTTTSAPSIYIEQPLSQNFILTARNQLMAIREKHKSLLTKSIPQLMRLDTKLIESYKSCFRNNHPLYGGMLFRTREYIIRLARDVKQERQVLEAMTKQIQKVLKDRAANKTLVKEYQRVQLETLVNNDESLRVTQKNALSQNDTIPKMSSSMQATRPLMLATGADRSSVKLLARNKQESSENEIPFGIVGVQQHDDDKRRSDMLVAIDRSSTKAFSIGESKLSPERRRGSITNKYTVHINEVNLKKQLKNTQALIDRINVSTHELNGIIDDILITLKISDVNTQKKGGHFGSRDRLNGRNNINSMGSSNDQRRMKKVPRTPLKNFLEKYGRLTMVNTNDVIGNVNRPTTTTIFTADKITKPNMDDTMNAIDMPESKPLFDANSLAYSEPSDLDLGFDSPSL